MKPGVLVAIPAFGAPGLTDAVLSDLVRDESHRRHGVAIVVVDNGGDYVAPDVNASVTVHRPGRNLRWIGSANWALQTAVAHDLGICVVLNNDVRLSPDFLTALTAPLADHDDAAMVASCYDDFWLHQRAGVVPPTAADYRPTPRLRDVPFCDGTAIAFAAETVLGLGGLDAVAFPRHGYGSDIDLALRARAAGLRCLVTEGAYVSHLRRATMDRVGASAEQNRAEILHGMDARWGSGWRAKVGLAPGAFPPHNTGSARSWYLEPERW